MIRHARFVFLLLSVTATLAIGSEIREFNVPTLERLGNELTRQSQRPDRGAIDPIRKQARQTAIAALQGKLFNIRYEYVVLNDPDGKRFLVYALGQPPKSDETVLGGHVRVTISADGRKVERIDRLSKTLMIDSKRTSGLPAGFHMTALYVNQILSNKPGRNLHLLVSSGAKEHLCRHARRQGLARRERQNESGHHQTRQR